VASEGTAARVPAIRGELQRFIFEMATANRR
jgi:hypothetical protein